ncbi:MAG: hypothetical protein DRI88_01440 [Bacteroidetes bacterium]|nr:MAG: hypothetical protein DRI88_01440 [Bacteroidota bacterium]RLD89110.1 MAG: hypothetical protein DRJ02_02230 [Bacteroidota bacterium]
MFKAKKRLNYILKTGVELYDAYLYSKTAQHLTSGQVKTIRKELREIADRQNYKVINFTKFIRPLILPTANRTTYESFSDLSEFNNKKKVVVFMPNHKSHLDEFIIGFKIFTEISSVPITAAGENLFKSKFSAYVLKSYGAFKIRRDKFSSDEHYSRLLYSYLGASIIAGNNIMTFQEGTRPRDGKIGLFRKGIIGSIENLFQVIKANPQQEIDDIYFVPIAINWSENPDEKKMTADREAKAEETDLLTRFLNLKKTHRSKDIRGVYLGFGEPVSYNQFVAEHEPDDTDSYAIGICNEVRSRVVAMMPVFTEHLLYSAVRFLSKFNDSVKVEDVKQLIDITKKNMRNDTNKIKIIETEGYSIESQLELMAQRDIIKFEEDNSGFNVLKPKLIEYYANHVTSLIEERKT